jgi:hypothetical protein
MGSATTTPSIDNLLASTLDFQSRKPVDQIFQKVPMWNWLLKNGKVDWDGSGATYRCPLTYAVSTAAGVVAGYGLVDTTPNEFIGETVYVMPRLYASVSYNQDEIDKNRSDKQLINLVNTKISQAKNTIATNANGYMFATSVATNAPNSIDTTVDSTGTVGGLNQSTYSWWASTETSLGSFAAGGIEGMQTIFNTLSIGLATGTPNLIVTSQTIYQYIQNAIRAYGMFDFASERTNDLGVPSIKFMGTDVIWDPHATASTIFFLNSDSLGIAIDGQANLKSTEFVKPADQLAYVGQIYLRAQLITTERRAQGKLTGVTA